MNAVRIQDKVDPNARIAAIWCQPGAGTLADAAHADSSASHIDVVDQVVDMSARMCALLRLLN